MKICYSAIPAHALPVAPLTRLSASFLFTFSLAARLVALVGTCGFDLASGTELVKGRRIETDTGIVFIEIPGGEFIMGGDANHPLREPDDPKPVNVKLSRYWISETEVSYKQYAKVLFLLTTGGHVIPDHPWPSTWPPVEKADLPVENVSYYDVQAFMFYLTQRVLNDGHFSSGRAALPSEAQWEYAARAGKQTPLTMAELTEFLKSRNENIGENEMVEVPTSARPIGLGSPNGFGIRDMLGNVSELCRDVFRPQLTGGIDPLVLGTNNIESVFIVIRGGKNGWSNRNGRFESRLRIEPYRGTGSLGFRVVWTDKGHKGVTDEKAPNAEKVSSGKHRSAPRQPGEGPPPAEPSPAPR